MAHSALTPVFVGLRTGLHALFLALAILVVGHAVVTPTASSVPVIVTTGILVLSYAGGVATLRPSAAIDRTMWSRIWLVAITVEWITLVWLASTAAYLVFPLFFLFLHLLGPRLGPAAVIAVTIVAIVALGVGGGWSVGGVVGPIVGAVVALLIGLGAQALAREAVERERLLHELLSTRDQLAATEHESGVLAERARLAREIHDTVAQGLSSIQLLLHAAERADPQRPGVEHIRLARETAAASLAETRRFIRELTPPMLDENGLGGALRRLAETQWRNSGVKVEVRVADSPSLPMHLQTALLRIAQGAVANVIQHAQATTASITLEHSGDEILFTVADDGQGFTTDELEPAATARADAAAVGSPSPAPRGRGDSFGLQATRERVDQLGGELTIESQPGRGSRLSVRLTESELT